MKTVLKMGWNALTHKKRTTKKIYKMLGEIAKKQLEDIKTAMKKFRKAKSQTQKS